MAYIEWIRSKVGHHKLLLVYASAYIENDQGQVLWQRRGDFGYWGLPGGVLELDETLVECAVREVKEETGLDVQIDRLTGIYSSPDFDVVYPNQDQVQQITFCYHASPLRGHLQADRSETLELQWLPKGQLPQTAIWYSAMALDAADSSSTVSYKRGSAGVLSSDLPFYKQIRPFIGHACFTSPGASVFVLNDKKELMLVQRQDNGDWDLPGGLMEPGERIDQAAIREAREESGWEVAIDAFIKEYSDADFIFSFPNKDKVRAVTAFFLGHTVREMSKPDPVETRRVQFFPLSQLPPLPHFLERMIKDALLFI